MSALLILVFASGGCGSRSEVTVEFGYENEAGARWPDNLTRDFERAKRAITKKMKYMMVGFLYWPRRTFWGGARDNAILVIDLNQLFKDKQVSLSRTYFYYSEHFGKTFYWSFIGEKTPEYCRGFIAAHSGGECTWELANDINPIIIRFIGLERRYINESVDGKIVKEEISGLCTMVFSIDGAREIPYEIGEHKCRIDQDLIPGDILEKYLPQAPTDATGSTK